jgi:ubiquinone/menaquinone biosynthesis C-methylase UbiE
MTQSRIDPSTNQPAPLPICDYEGAAYRTDFWEGQGRAYEDLVERIALRALLPPQGDCVIELGAGYGRTADLYTNYRRVILTDRAYSHIRQAKERLGQDPRFSFVVADAYALPFRAEAVAQVVSVRMLHHLVDVPRALAEIARILQVGGCYLTEFASKRHLKAIVRYGLGRQTENPFSPAPHEFVKLNFDFHPRWMTQQLSTVGLRVEARRAVSHFRLGWLKRRAPLAWLVAADRALQRIGALWPWTPSIFVRARKAQHET